MTPLLKAGLTLVLCLAVTGCSLAPDYKRPEQDIPKEWRSVDLGPSPLNTDWWTRFNDPVLNALVEEALKNNQDLAESLAKIDSAAAKLGVGTSQLAPSVSGAGAATSQSNSTKIANYNSIADRSYVNYQGQLSASWELDFWGKYRNNYTMLSDVLLNTVVSHEALRLSVASQTAQSYFALLALDMQLATAKRTLRTREDAFGIYTSRYRQGDITELDWQRARAEVETARAQVHSSTVAVDSAEASLAVLLGRSPRDIMSAVMPRGGAIIQKMGMEGHLTDFVRGDAPADAELLSMTVAERLAYARKETWGTFKKVFPYILLGVGIGAFIHNWIPAEWIELVLGDGNPFAVVLATLVGAPIYADTFGAIPIAEALYYKGTGLGTVLAFMMSVTTLSIPSLTMLSRVIKPRLMVTFVGLCIVGMCISGYVFNFLQPLF